MSHGVADKKKRHRSAPARILIYLGDRRYIAWYIAVLGLLASSLFSFVIFPAASGSQHIVLDPDAYGNLGYGILKYHEFSYYPDREPTVERGPLYPAFIALLLAISNDWWPYAVQLGQCVLLAIMCAMVFWTSRHLWNKPTAVLTAGLCAVHPLAIWYTSRIWIETISMFLFTAMIAGTLYFALRPSLPRALVLGCILGASSLCKSTLLPYVALAPLLLWLLKANKAKLGLSAMVVIIAVVVIAPWTVRNWKLTGRFIPVHARMGWNIEMGDELVEHIGMAPFSLAKIWDASRERAATELRKLPEGLKKHEKELRLDSVLLKVSMQRYRSHPWFFVKKVLVNAWLFWTLGESPRKSAVIATLLLSLLALTTISTVSILRRKQMKAIMGVHILLMLVYYIMHLPVQAIARYSVVLVPAMIMYGIGPIMQRVFEDKREI